VHSRGRQVGLIANDSKGTVLEPHRAVRQDRLILDYLAVATADGRTSLTKTLAWDRIRRLPRRAIAVITPSADEGWVRLLQAVRGRRSSMIVFYLDVASFGGPDQNPSFDLGQDVDLYVVRKGDDFARLMRTRDAIRIG
jgi:transposase